MWIIVTGNPVDGFEFFGIFETETEGIDWADAAFDDRDWWLASVSEYRNPTE